MGIHLVRRLKSNGYTLRAADLRYPEFRVSPADQFLIGDLRSQSFCDQVFSFQADEVYQLAADMGGAGYIFTGENDAKIMHNSALINLNVIERCRLARRVFYSSSACIYPAHNQESPNHPICSEDSVYPAAPDSEYGWEKLFSERVYAAFARNYGVPVRVGRFHNIFCPETAWTGGREKAPAAICRKIAEVRDGGTIDIWGDGQQSRSFLYIDECIDGIIRLTRSEFPGPVNIGSSELVTINELVDLVANIAGKDVHRHHVSGPQGVRGRNSDNRLIYSRLSWKPVQPLRYGLEKTYEWVEKQVRMGSRHAGLVSERC